MICLERREDLCRRGQARADEERLSGCRFEVADVLERGRAQLSADTTAFALHACGDLWRTLLDVAADTEATAIAAPCCYHHLQGARHYSPRSRRAQAGPLSVSQSELRLSVSEERVARPAIARARARAEAWRLGLDLLLREASGEDEYRPQGHLPKALFDLDFETFCHRAAELMQRDLPKQWSAERAEAAGWVRGHEVRALGLVRAIYRRPMELWQVFDAALAQVERGREVHVASFCAPHLTPRNLIVLTRPR